MLPHVPFLKTILESPDDPGPRLVYSDWLEETGETDLAEFLRLGVELHKLPPVGQSEWAKAIQLRRNELLDQNENRERWVAPFADGPEFLVHHHWSEPLGFMTCHVMGSTEEFIEQVNAQVGLSLFPHAWFLEPNNLHNSFERFQNCSHLDWLQGLNLVRIPISTQQVEFIANCERLSNIQMLFFYSAGLTDSACRAIAANTMLGRLRDFEADHNQVTEDGLHAILNSRRLPMLRRLSIGENEFRGNSPSPLKNSGRQPRLNVLNLSRNHLGDEGVRWLANWTGLAELSDLRLPIAEIGAIGAAAVASSPHLTNLTRLDLQGNPLGDDGVRALMSAPYIGQLTELRLNRCNIGPAGALAVLAAPALPKSVVMLDNPLGEMRTRLPHPQFSS